ncbi:hypothetical protein, partial [Francisella tularensis]|uniref:hypothetical protein n=1 Tax=Francisella tularensis TaxID=263 RepID=UPI002381B890
PKVGREVVRFNVIFDAYTGLHTINIKIITAIAKLKIHFLQLFCTNQLFSLLLVTTFFFI